MLQLLPHSFTVTPNINNPTEVIKYIDDYISRYHCENLSVDLSFMNTLDACYVSTMCSTTHFIKYPDGNIHWKVCSDKVKGFCKDFELGNCTFEHL